MGKNRTPGYATRSIRAHLVQLVLVCIVPIGVFAGGMLYLHWQVQEKERERSQVESARLLATAVDNALDATIARLSIFARLWTSSPISDQGIYTHAKETLRATPEWSNIVAFRADGSGVFRADEPFGTAIPRMQLLSIWRPVIEEQRPHVSDVFASPVTGSKLVSVGVPVVREGKVTHVLIAVLNLKWFDQLLNKQGLPEGGVAGIFDRNWKFVARGREGDERRGSDAHQGLVADMQARQEGVGRYDSLNALPVYTAWTRTQHGWAVAAATPAAPTDSAFWKHFAAFGCLWLAAIMAAFWLAWSKSRRLANSIQQLEARAETIGTGRPVARLNPSEVTEVQRALVALDGASALLQDAMHQRDRLFDDEREAREAAEAASRAKDEFLALLGHELRNPLAAISNASAILGMRDHTAGQSELALAVIDRQARHLKRLIDDLLDVGRVMNGKIALDREPMDLAACARRVVRTLDTAGRLVDRRVEVDAEATWIDGDSTRMEQIITNLLANAAAHTRPGGRIGVRVRSESDRALLEVRDDGDGILPTDLPHVFELFFQAQATPDRARGGLGIGLTLVKRLAQLHGGFVSVESAGRGMGATFAVRMPAIQEPASAKRATAAPRDVMPTTVLLVEDNMDERETLRIALELHGHTVISAADGPTAVSTARRARPPVAVLDIGLPGMDGYRVAAALRREFGDRIFLIALTGYGTRTDARKAQDAGFDMHLTKPVAPEDLARAVDVMSPARVAPSPASRTQKAAS